MKNECLEILQHFIVNDPNVKIFKYHHIMIWFNISEMSVVIMPMITVISKILKYFVIHDVNEKIFKYYNTLFS